MQRLRVLMVVRLFYPWVGGTERQAHKLAQKLKEKDVDVEIVTGWWFLGTPQREVIDGVPVFRNHTMWEMFHIKGLRKFGGYIYICSLLWYLWRHRGRYDIIHAHALNYHAFAVALAGRWFKRRTLVKLANSGRASDIAKMRQDQHLLLERYFLPTALNCDQYVALNTTIVEELIGTGVSAERIVQLPNGVETDVIATRSNYDLNDPVRLIFVGRLHPQKGLEVLFRALQRLCTQYSHLSLRLQLIGDGPLRSDLSLLAEELGLASHVDFVGQTQQVYEHLQQADIFVLPSRAEGVSNALLEAMACGLPVVVSNVPGNVDVVENEKNGLVFVVDNPDLLAAAVASLLTQPELRRRLGTAARHTVESGYSLDRIVDRYIALYQNLLAPEAWATT